jgi:hypothetical protein
MNYVLLSEQAARNLESSKDVDKAGCVLFGHPDLPYMSAGSFVTSQFLGLLIVLTLFTHQ